MLRLNRVRGVIPRAAHVSWFVTCYCPDPWILPVDMICVHENTFIDLDPRDVGMDSTCFLIVVSRPSLHGCESVSTFA
ncbi:hypothetical protein LIA77_00002 [Sarocladium implicatum]|nr:hypothetical protein LIA77_00002 [Sarocladium implicatum]